MRDAPDYQTNSPSAGHRCARITPAAACPHMGPLSIWEPEAQVAFPPSTHMKSSGEQTTHTSLYSHSRAQYFHTTHLLKRSFGNIPGIWNLVVRRLMPNHHTSNGFKMPKLDERPGILEHKQLPLRTFKPKVGLCRVCSSGRARRMNCVMGGIRNSKSQWPSAPPGTHLGDLERKAAPQIKADTKGNVRSGEDEKQSLNKGRMKRHRMMRPPQRADPPLIDLLY